MNLKSIADELQKKISYNVPQKLAQIASSPKINQFAQSVNNLVESSKQGFERVKQTPASEFFLPTSQKFRDTTASVGKMIQKFPDTSVDIPYLNPSLVGVGNFSPINATKFVTGLPGEMVKGYGKTMQKYGERKKFNFWDYMNLGDFIPGMGFVGGLTESVGREGIEKAVKLGGEKILKNTSFEGLSTIKNIADNSETLSLFKRRLNPEYISAIKEAGFNTVSDFWKSNKEGFIKMDNLLSESLAQTKFRRSQAMTSIQKTKEFMSDMKREFRSQDGAFKRLTPKEKVNIFDYIRTPDRVLSKMGLGDEAKQLRVSWENYLDELPQEISKITSWSKRAPRPESNRLIFKYLDGQVTEKVLLPQEIGIASEIKDYFRTWADKLKLPQENRLTNYITRIWDTAEDSTKGVEFPEEIAGLIRDKVAGSVYDPFVTKRLGQRGYVEDTWRALDAYVKRATRKVNLDGVLGSIKSKAEGLEDSQFKYVKSYIDRVNLRPTDTDLLVDNLVKSFAGYKFGDRPVTSISKKARQMVYRGLLGLNPATALKNLSQGANTYAELGERYTLHGYTKVIQELPKYLKGLDTELEKVGVLRNGFIEDRTLSSTRKFWEKTDNTLFGMFNLAEKINRGASYYGGKARALSEGKSYQEAIEAGKDLVRRTQFTFSAVDTPVGLQSDIVKTLTQFMSYSVKQAEFLGEKASKREIAGLIRYVGASLLFVFTVGKAIGMEPKDIIPSVRVGTPPTLQLPKGIYDVASGTPDKFGNEPDPNLLKRFIQNKDVKKGLSAYIPGGNQILNKTFPGISDVLKGESTTPAGNVRYPVDQSASNLIKGGLFGSYNLPEAQQYYDEKRKPLSENQSALLRGAEDKKGVYNQVMAKREENSLVDRVKESLGLGQSDKIEEAQKASFTIKGEDMEGFIVGNKFLYLDDEGEPKSTKVSDLNKSELSYQKELVDAQFTLTVDRLKRADDINSWVATTEVYIKFLEQYKTQATDEADKLRVQNKIEDLQVTLEKYKSYGGFKKGRKPAKVSIKKVSPIKVSSLPEPKKVAITGLKANSLSKPNIKLEEPGNIYNYALRP